MRLIEKERVGVNWLQMEEDNQSLISLSSSYPLLLCTFVPPDLTHTHTHIHAHTHGRTVIKCSSCVKCQAGLFSDIWFEPIQMLPFLPLTRQNRGGEALDEQGSTLLEEWRRVGKQSSRLKTPGKYKPRKAKRAKHTDNTDGSSERGSASSAAEG